MTKPKTAAELLSELADVRADHTALAARIKELEAEAQEARNREREAEVRAIVKKAFVECPRLPGRPHVLHPVAYSLEVGSTEWHMTPTRSMSAEAVCGVCGVRMTLHGAEA